MRAFLFLTGVSETFITKLAVTPLPQLTIPMKNHTSGSLKYLVGWLVVFALRLLPHPPNVAPVMATLMPFSKRYGAIGGFVFAALSIILYDAVTSGIGMWTWITTGAYGALGVAAYYWLRNRANKSRHYVMFAIVGTIVYDVVTGLSVGPLFFGQPFMEALVGQIPFTLYHLAGNIVLSAIVSPTLYRWVVSNEKLEVPAVLARFGRFSRA